MKDLTHQDFARELEQPFRLQLPQEVLELRLIEVKPYSEGVPPDWPREPFSLFFAGPPGRILPQAIYRLENDGMGALDIFLVPIGADATAVRYEAVFS